MIIQNLLQFCFYFFKYVEYRCNQVYIQEDDIQEDDTNNTTNSTYCHPPNSYIIERY